MTKKKGGFFKFLAGIGIGAAAGVLLAPKAGSETRKELKAQFESTGVYIDEKLKNKGSDSGGYSLYRYLDCAVVENYLNKAKDKKTLMLMKLKKM